MGAKVTWVQNFVSDYDGVIETYISRGVNGVADEVAC